MLSSFMFEDIFICRVWLKKQNCGLCFFPPILFKTYYDSGFCFSIQWVAWGLFLKRSTPSLGSAVPSGWSAASNFTSSQHICYGASGSFCWELYIIAFDCGLMTSTVWRSINILQDPCPLLPASLGSSYYPTVIFTHILFIYLIIFPMTQNKSRLPLCSFLLITLADIDLSFRFLLL